MVNLNSDAASIERAILKFAAEQASDLMKALSHEARLLILCILCEGEKTVSELEEFLEIPQAAVSQQLARLRAEGLVKTRRDGRKVFYSHAHDEIERLMHLLYEFFCKPGREKQR